MEPVLTSGRYPLYFDLLEQYTRRVDIVGERQSGRLESYGETAPCRMTRWCD